MCGLCFKKQGLRPITEKQVEQLRNLVISSFSLSDSKYQKVLCKTCALALSAHTDHPEKPGRKLPKPHYENLRPPPPDTRANYEQPCTCTVCEIAACNLVPGKVSGPAVLLEKHWNLLFPDETYPGKKSVAPCAVESRCTNCHAVVGKGRSHKCTKTQMQANLHKLVKQKSLKSKEKIGGKVLKNIFDANLVTRRGGTVLLATGSSRKLPVTLSLKLNKPRFSHESLRRLQVAKGDSDRGIKKFAMAIRHVFGFKSVEPGFAGTLTARNKCLEEFFEVKEFELKQKPSNKKKECGCDCKCGREHDSDEVELDDDGYQTVRVPGVVVKDLDSYVRAVVDARGYSPDAVQVICGLDNGQKFNKIGFIVRNKNIEVESTGRKERGDELFSDVFKDSGVKRLHLAAVIPACPENYHNQKAMLEALGMEGLEWGTTVDLKMSLCLLGKSMGQLTFGCPYCDMAKPYREPDYNLLTLGRLVELHEAYVQAGERRKDQAKFQNCVFPNLLVGDPGAKVLSILFPPELHLLIGIVDKHLQGLEKVFGLCWVDNFLKNVNIVRKSYQGSHALEGNQSSMFLKKLPQLEQAIMQESDQLKVEGLPLLQSLRQFRKVQEACFGQYLQEGYEQTIQEFSKMYKSLDNMTITPKVHIVEHHLSDFFKEMGEAKYGLGWYSEQSFEAMHHDMMQEWERVKISDPNHPDFGPKLLKFVLGYNARHMN